MSAIHRASLQLRDFARFSPAVNRAARLAIEARDALTPRRDATALARSVEALSRAARITRSPRALARLERKLKARVRRIDPAALDWDALFPRTSDPVLRKAIVLKAPAPPGERGVLFVSFEDQWLTLLRHADPERLAREYHLVLSPTWSPPHDLPMLLAARMWPAPLFTILSNFDDVETFRRLDDGLVPVPLLASSWVDPRHFTGERPVEKPYDVVMLANFALYKRHHLLFRTLARMRPGVRALLLGKSWEDRTAETLRDEARAYGVLDRVTIREGLPDEKMVRALKSAKVGLILSGNEGSCVAVAEKIFADVPVGLLHDAIIGSKAFINERTGRLLDERDLAAGLTRFIDDHEAFDPRAWALEAGISCVESSRALEAALRDEAAARGEAWTRGIASFCWRPNPRYLDDADARRLRGAYDALERDHGLRIPLEPLTSGASLAADRGDT